MMDFGVDEKAQISLDFLIAIVIFTLTITFLLQTLSGLFVPFQSSSDELQSLSERVAAELVENTGGLSLIPDSNHPNVINKTNIENLNTTFGTTPEEYTDAISQLGLIGDWENDINISIRNFDDALYYEINNTQPLLQTGAVPPEYQNVAQSKRVVLYNSTNYLVLVVQVW